METTEQTQIAVYGSQELEKVIEKSGIDLSEAENIKSSYLPFLVQFEEVKSQSVKINTENPTPLDEEIAGKLRRATVKIRTAAKAFKDDRKRIYLLKGGIEQDCFNLISKTCEMAELEFEKVEKASAIKEAARKELLKAERIEKMRIFNVDLTFYDLANMTQEAFQSLFDGTKLSYEQKVAAELKAEQDRIAAIEAQKKEREIIRLENERLKKEAEEKEKAIAIERKKAADEKAKQDAILQAERKKQDELLEAKRKEAEKIKAAADAKLQKEREEKEKLQAQIKAKEDAEKKAESDRIAKEAADLKAKRIADAKAAKAPDKEKLNKWVDSFEIQFGCPGLKPESEKTYNSIIDKFNAFKSWAKSEIEKI